MSETEDQPREGLKLLRCSPLPSFSRPFVFIVWRKYRDRGDEVAEIQFFILFHDREIDARGLALDGERIGQGGMGTMTQETLERIGEDQALDVLEAIARNEFNELGASRVFFHPIRLEEISEDDVFVAAHRECWTDQWREVLRRTYSSQLRVLIERIQRSPLRDFRFNPLAPFRPF